MRWTTGELCETFDLKPTDVLKWCEKGWIGSTQTDKGKGRHRLFNHNEAFLVLLVQSLIRVGLIGSKLISRLLRNRQFLRKVTFDELWLETARHLAGTFVVRDGRYCGLSLEDDGEEHWVGWFLDLRTGKSKTAEGALVDPNSEWKVDVRVNLGAIYRRIQDTPPTKARLKKEGEEVITRLKMEIFRREIRQFEFASALKMDPTRLSRIVRGHLRPSLRVAKQIADQLGMSVEDVFPGMYPKTDSTDD